MSKPSHTHRTDLRTILDNIDVQLRQMRCSVNAVSGQLLAMAIAIECITLTQKLRVTLRRWETYLPFHECRDVNFKYWIRYLTNIHKSLNSRQNMRTGAPDYEYYPDHSFSLDLLDIVSIETRDTLDMADGVVDSSDGVPVYAPRYGESELQTDVKEYVSRLDERMKSLAELSEDEELEWKTSIDKQAMRILRKQYADHLRMVFRNEMSRNQVEKEILPKVRDYLNAVIEQPTMAYCLDMALDTLIDVLRQMDQLFSDDKDSQQFLRLSLRLFYRHCPDALPEAVSEVHRWSSEWPVRRRKQRAIEKRDQLVDRLRQQYGDLRIGDYIDIEHPNPLTDFEFGHFLFASRYKMEIDNVKTLFQDCFLIQQLNLLIDPVGAEADISATFLSEHRKQIYQRLGELVRQAEWQGGMTVERVQHSFSQLLLKTSPSADNKELATISETFWRLLTSRRNCEEEFRSLKLTWLNLAGYFRSRGFLRGGSLTLCRRFFPDNTPEGRDNGADYNAVNKGAGDRAGNDFHDLILVLDEMLKKTPPF